MSWMKLSELLLSAKHCIVLCVCHDATLVYLVSPRSENEII